jgi:5-formyltetrahydrofolate cyclo-ligase
MEKEHFRKLYWNKRETLSHEEIDALSLEIANKVLKLPIWQKTYYHIFLSIENKKEIDTSYLLHILQGRDKSVVVPKVDFETGAIRAILLQENTVLKPSNYGIPEPEDGIELPPDLMDIVFVPLLAYDNKGNRLGYGKGFYDKFLTQCAPSCMFIGLSLFEPEDSLPHTSLDIPLHYCVTPKTTYKF